MKVTHDPCLLYLNHWDDQFNSYTTVLYKAIKERCSEIFQARYQGTFEGVKRYVDASEKWRQDQEKKQKEYEERSALPHLPPLPRGKGRFIPDM